MTLEMDLLLDEVGRYLAAVDVFRAEGAVPHWLPEAPARPKRRARRGAARVEAGSQTP